MNKTVIRLFVETKTRNFTKAKGSFFYMNKPEYEEEIISVLKEHYNWITIRRKAGSIQFNYSNDQETREEK